MSVTIPKKYLKGRDDAIFYPSYIISAPENVPELDGYVMKSLLDQTVIATNNLTINRGNEWNKKQQKFLYMFEKEVKTPGHPAKRYRYTEDELIKLYGNALSSTFEKRLKKRSDIINKGPGKLIRASYTNFTKREGKKSEEEWFISPDADEKWVYPFDYDLLRDKGKHNRDAKGFAVLEEYTLPDIAVLWEHKDQLPRLLHNLDHIRNLQVEKPPIYEEWIFGKLGKMISASTLAESLAFKAYKQIPREICTEKILDYFSEKSEGEALRTKLMQLSTEMEKICNEVVQKYRTEKLTVIIAEIKELIGININK